MKLTPAVSSKDHAQGPADAPCTLVEYGDFQCLSCGKAYPIVKRVQKHFGDRLRFVFREFPLPMHPMAGPAAEAAEFAATQGKFWPMHDGLYRNQEQLSEELFAELAAEVGLDPEALSRSLADREFEERVAEDLEGGEASGVPGTPTFYINGQRHEGSFDERTLIGAIDAALRG